VREDDDAIIGSDQRRDVLARVSRRADEGDVRRDLEPLGVAGGPQVALVDRPVIVEMGRREERRVQRVVGMVMREHYLSHVARLKPLLREWFEDGLWTRNETGIDHYHGVPVADQGDSRADPMIRPIQVSLEEDVDLRHASSIGWRQLREGPMAKTFEPGVGTRLSNGVFGFNGLAGVGTSAPARAIGQRAQTGQVHTVPVGVMEVDGRRYMVAEIKKHPVFRLDPASV